MQNLADSFLCFGLFSINRSSAGRVLLPICGAFIPLPLSAACTEGARDAVDVLELADAGHDPLDLVDVADTESELDGGGFIAPIWCGIDGLDVDLHFRRHGEDLGEHPVAVVADDLDADGVLLVQADIPAHLDHARKLGIIEDVRAVGAVHGDAASTCDVARDRVPRDGVAAACEAHEVAALPFDEDAMTCLFPLLILNLSAILDNPRVVPILKPIVSCPPRTPFPASIYLAISFTALLFKTLYALESHVPCIITS